MTHRIKGKRFPTPMGMAPRVTMAERRELAVHMAGDSTERVDALMRLPLMDVAIAGQGAIKPTMRLRKGTM